MCESFSNKMYMQQKYVFHFNQNKRNTGIRNFLEHQFNKTNIYIYIYKCGQITSKNYTNSITLYQINTF